MKLTNVVLRNFAYDLYDINTQTLRGMVQYIEWLEDLIDNPDKLKSTIELIEANHKFTKS